MFSYRGAFVLIALCAFGAIQASFEAENEGVVYDLSDGPHNSSHSGNHSHPHHPGHSNSSHPSGPHGNQSHPHHPGHSNSSHPHPPPPHGNSSHPHHPGHGNSSHPLPPPHGNSSHPHHPGHSNSSHPGHPSGNHSHPHHPGHSNSSHPVNLTVPSGNSEIWRPRPHRPRFVFGPGPVRRHRFDRPIKNENSGEEVREKRSIFSWFHRNTTRRPNVYQPVYRPSWNSSYNRPANNSWSYWG